MDPVIIFSAIILLGIISFILTYLIMKFAIRNKLTVTPNERSLHDIPTPQGGGISITITWFAGITLLFFGGIIGRDLFYALLCGIILAFVSFLDDLKDIKPVFRLVAQFITAGLAFYLLHGLRPLYIGGIVIPFNYITFPLIITGMVWFINLFNFMDGADGFASVEVIVVSCVLFVMTWNIINILLIICVAGFLCWNWPRAKIFMGDVGSTQLGFVLIVLGLYFHNTSDFSILNWIMLTSAFWFDATLTLFRRWRNGEKLSQAHRKHAYQRLIKSGLSHGKVNAWLILLNLVIVVFIIIYSRSKVLQLPAFISCILFYYFVIRIVDRKAPFQKKNTI